LRFCFLAPRHRRTVPRKFELAGGAHHPHREAENVTPFDAEEAVVESLRGCYPETVEVGWLKLDTVDILKEMDPIAWDLARDECVDADHSEGNLITIDHGATYYAAWEVEQYLDEVERT
jgi:hypothetical protein